MQPEHDQSILHEQEQFDQESQQRVEKVQQMVQEGIDPWPEARSVDHAVQNILKEFDTKFQRAEYQIAGRIISMREHGKITFLDVQDATGSVQLYVKKSLISGVLSYEQFEKFIDIGDIIWIKGPAFRTKMGEVTLEVHELVLLSKCLHPLPGSFYGLTDVEKRYRQRYLDLIVNKEAKERFICRSKLVCSLRSTLDEKGYLEVETPMLHPIAGGAAARPFVTHHHALDSDFYLRIAPELYLKRLIIGGFEKIYEINRNFRNEGISTRHNPEFTMLEFYTAYKDYQYIMDFVEHLLRTVILKACLKLEVAFGEHIIDFAQTFERLSPKQAILAYTNISADQLTDKKIDKTLQQYEVKGSRAEASLNEKVFALFEEVAEPLLIQPTFIVGFPIEISPLSKRDTQNENIAARFELFIGGMEIANGFNELNDPFDQAERFRGQLQAHRAGDDEAHQYDEEYIQALEYALPPTVGVGIGIDRLVMLATNATSIKDVILFPTLKKRQ